MRIPSLDDDNNDDSTSRRRHDSETSSLTSPDSESLSEGIEEPTVQGTPFECTYWH